MVKSKTGSFLKSPSPLYVPTRTRTNAPSKNQAAEFYSLCSFYFEIYILTLAFFAVRASPVSRATGINLIADRERNLAHCHRVGADDEETGDEGRGAGEGYTVNTYTRTKINYYKPLPVACSHQFILFSRASQFQSRSRSRESRYGIKAHPL